MRRLEGVESRWLRHSLVVALGGFASPDKNTRILFCRDTFDYPDLEGHELLCNHLAPKLKGRPRGKRKKRSISPGGSESNESEASVSVASAATVKVRKIITPFKLYLCKIVILHLIITKQFVNIFLSRQNNFQHNFNSYGILLTGQK